MQRHTDFIKFRMDPVAEPLLSIVKMLVLSLVEAGCKIAIFIDFYDLNSYPQLSSFRKNQCNRGAILIAF